MQYINRVFSRIYFIVKQICHGFIKKKIKNPVCFSFSCKNLLAITVYGIENSGMTIFQCKKKYEKGSFDINVQCQTNNTYLNIIHINLYNI